MKIGIIGSGFVGATTAYAMVMRGVGRHIVLIDLDKDRAAAEADDIQHAVPFAHPMNVTAGDPSELEGSRLVILTAGAAQRPGESRLELLERNAAIFRQLIPQVLEHAPEALLLVATNPVDVMTHLTALYASGYGVPPGRVIGSGTTLDTARFRALLGRALGVDPHHIHAYVVGEHGDSEVLTWSLVTVGGIPLEDFCHRRGLDFSQADRDEIERQVREAAYRIIAGKGATYYGIGSALARIADVILRDQRSILTICTRVPEMAGVQDVTLSLPNLLGGAGVLSTLPMPLNAQEQSGLEHSAQVIQKAIMSLNAGEFPG